MWHEQTWFDLCEIPNGIVLLRGPLLDRKCQNTVLKEKSRSEAGVGPLSKYSTFTPPTQRLETSSRIPQQKKGSVLLSSSQTHVQIFGDIRRQQVPEHNSCCCCESLAPKLPRGAWCQSWFGFITYPVLHICKVCYGRKRNVTVKRLGGRRSYVMKEVLQYPPPFFFF